MSKPKLTYFDAPISRGEECRIALHLAGVDFEDNRIPFAQWPALKPTTPYGTLPLYEAPGQPIIGQSIPILVLVGRQHGLHPKDDYEAARHEAMMNHVEDLRRTITATTAIKDEAEKKKAREALVAGPIPTWAEATEREIGDRPGPFFGGAAINVVDVKLFVIVSWIQGGGVDHVPVTIFDAYPKLLRIHAAVRDDARVKEWVSRR